MVSLNKVVFILYNVLSHSLPTLFQVIYIIFYKQFYEFAYLTRFRAKYDRDFHSFLKENIELCYEDIEVTIGTPTVVDPRDAG